MQNGPANAAGEIDDADVGEGTTPLRQGQHRSFVSECVVHLVVPRAPVRQAVSGRTELGLSV